MKIKKGDNVIVTTGRDKGKKGTVVKTFRDIDKVIVGMGPGPFTGLRVGISFAQSFALARGISWTGVCSLDAIASQFYHGAPDQVHIKRHLYG